MLHRIGEVNRRCEMTGRRHPPRSQLVPRHAPPEPCRDPPPLDVTTAPGGRPELTGLEAERRQPEADREALRIRYESLKDRSAWAQESVAQGYDTADNLWDIAQKLTTERSGELRLTARIRSKRLKIAHYAGAQGPALLAYLQGRSEPEAPRGASRFAWPAVESGGCGR